MAYDLDTWRERHGHRNDITSTVTHLTREAIIDGKEYSAVAVLVKILNEKCIRASTTESGFIVGRRPAVCFQGAPLLGLAENIRYEESLAHKTGKTRYRGVGLAFHKGYAFLQGARPVLYEKTEVAKRFLPRDEHWRLVDLDLSNAEAIVDWTHEREWRSPGDFRFELRYSALIVSTSDDYRELLDLANAHLLRQVFGVTVLRHAIA